VGARLSLLSLLHKPLIESCTCRLSSPELLPLWLQTRRSLAGASPNGLSCAFPHASSHLNRPSVHQDRAPEPGGPLAACPACRTRCWAPWRYDWEARNLGDLAHCAAVHAARTARGLGSLRVF
jgi:hypothetical protein